MACSGPRKARKPMMLMKKKVGPPAPPSHHQAGAAPPTMKMYSSEPGFAEAFSEVRPELTF